MRAVVLAAPGRTEVIDVPIAAPAAGDVRIDVEGCGVCGSSVPLWEGRTWFSYPRPPGAPGHEGWGRVVLLGESVDSLRIGDRVTFLHDEAFAESVNVTADHVVRVPPSLDASDVPGEALACAWNAAARSDFRPGQNVAVIGVGFMGALMVAQAASAGCRVIAVSRRPFALEIARAMGASETVALADTNRAAATVVDLCGGALCERVVEAAGLQASLDLASQLTAEGGRLVIVGYHQDGTREVDMQLWNWRGFDVINAHERDRRVVVEGMRRAVDDLARGAVDLAPLYTHHFGMDDLAGAFRAMTERPDGFLKAMVRT